MTRRGGRCGHCASSLSLPRLRTDVSVAAVTLGLVGLTGCELFDQTVGKALGWSTEQTDTAVNDIYGSPEMMEDPEVTEPPPADPEEPGTIYGQPPTYEEPADIYGNPSMMDETEDGASEEPR